MKAILLLGPTGTGKSPLGDWLEESGLWGRRCFHFDFGAQLRILSLGKGGDIDLTPEEGKIIDVSLKTGALLEDEFFYLAEKILRNFMIRRGMGAPDLILLNGMPRHVGQAHCLEGLVSIAALVHLECTAECVRIRIGTDSGGDRAGRIDDDPQSIEMKLELFAERSIPLVDFYRSRDVPVLKYRVEEQTSAEEVAVWLEGRPIVL